jgi:uncharacterized protein
VGFEVIVGLVAALAGGIASLAGFGIGSLLTPLLASHYDMKAAVGAVSIPHVTATALRFWKLRRDVDRKVLLGFGAMNACGALIGALAHSRLGGSALTAVLGALLVLAGAIGLLGYADKIRFGETTAWIAGAVSGAFGGLVGNQGGIRSAAMLGIGVQGPAFVATSTAIGLTVDAVRMPIYFATESAQIFRAWPATVAAIVGVVAGTVIGERILRKIPQGIFRKVVAAVLLCVGIYILFGSSTRA